MYNTTHALTEICSLTVRHDKVTEKLSMFVEYNTYSSVVKVKCTHGVKYTHGVAAEQEVLISFPDDI